MNYTIWLIIATVFIFSGSSVNVVSFLMTFILAFFLGFILDIVSFLIFDTTFIDPLKVWIRKDNH